MDEIVGTYGLLGAAVTYATVQVVRRWMRNGTPSDNDLLDRIASGVEDHNTKAAKRHGETQDLLREQNALIREMQSFSKGRAAGRQDIRGD